MTPGCVRDTATGQRQRGSEAWQRYCRQCHDAESGIGSRLTRRSLAGYSDAAGLIRYNRQFMPYGAEATLTGQEYIDVTAYLLSRYGFVDDDDADVLTADNAGEIPLTPR